MLTEALLKTCAQEAGLTPVALVLRRLDQTQVALSVDAHAPFYPASMIKTPLAIAVLTLVEAGELRLDHRYGVSEANMTLNDKPSPLQPGYQSTLQELIELMLTRSDNVATNMLYDVAGRERATAIVQQRFGLMQTAFHRKLSGSTPLIQDPEWDSVHLNTHPPADAARLFEAIAQSRVPFAWMLQHVLARQEWNNKLSAGLHAGDVFLHKTGDTDEVTHDGGILYTNNGRAYCLIAYTGMESNDAHNARFAEFMSALRPHL